MRQLRPCGTEAGYSRHLRNGEAACEACVMANRKASREAARRMKARRAAGIPARTPDPCGTNGAYQRHLRKGETCDVCWTTLPAARRAHRLSTKFQMTPADFETMFDSQDRRCAICRTDQPGRSWNIDHDHSCCDGKRSCGRCVRGILCQLCNQGLGQFRDNTDHMRAAITYLGAFHLT